MKITKFMTIALAATILAACGGKQSSATEGSEDQAKETKQDASKAKKQEGVLKGVFSISASKKVHFSQGNLQYLPATKKWQLAKNQYDYIGLSNSDISADYDGWIDLFGWGTSGWNNGGNAYQPTSTGSTPMSYGEYYYGHGANDITGEYANADWGVFNAISNGGNEPNLWRTLTAKEWEYLLFKRPNALQLLALGTIGGVNGLFILPDDFEAEDVFYTLGDRDYSYGSLEFDGKCFYNKYSDYWSSFQKADMKDLDALGVVFLPAAGDRIGKSICSINKFGYYWTTTKGKVAWNYSVNSTYSAAAIRFSGEGVSLIYGGERSDGYSVRLVQDIIE